MPHFGDPDGPVTCSGHRRDGAQCGAPAMAGQTVCRMHGGSSPQARRVGKERVAERSAEQNASPRRTSPEAALQEELDRTQGRVDWYEQQLLHQPNDAALLAAHARERDRLTKVTTAMMAKKVPERLASLAERAAGMADGVLQGVLRELGHDPHSPRVREAIARHIGALAAASAPVALPPVHAASVRAEEVIDAEVIYTDAFGRPVEPVEF